MHKVDIEKKAKKFIHDFLHTMLDEMKKVVHFEQKMKIGYFQKIIRKPEPNQKFCLQQIFSMIS